MKKTDYYIRELCIDDFTDLDKHFGDQSPYKNPRRKWENYLNQQNTGVRAVRVVEKDNQVIGIATLKYYSDYPSYKLKKIPEINDLLIALPYRKQGYGRALISALETVAKEMGYKTIGLAVGLYQDYGSAQRLYFNMGYIPDGMGISYQDHQVIPGQSYPVDDDLLLWLSKSLVS